MPTPRDRRAPRVHRAASAVARPVRRFAAVEASTGLVLLLATTVAVAWASSPWRAAYRAVAQGEAAVSLGSLRLSSDLAHVTADGLMTLFFLVIGLEIRHEWVDGELRDRRSAALPMVAAIGGMVVPALLYLAVEAGGPGGHGWGIPMATDLAFTLGLVALLGPRVPGPLRTFLLTLAIVDDVGAIVVIAVAYAGPLSIGWAAVAAGLTAAFAWLRRFRMPAAVFVACGVGLWGAVLLAGMHPTIAGVVLGLLAPVSTRRRHRAHERLLARLHPWTGFVAVPAFAFANAGVRLSGGIDLTAGATSGVVLGLVVGKVIGITGATWLAVRLGVARLPTGVRWAHLVGLAALAGVGFTVSLFVSDLAFATPHLAEEAKVGVLVASVLAAGVGSSIFVATGRTDARRAARATRSTAGW